MPPITPLRTLDRNSPTFKADCNAFFGTEMQAFSVQAEAARLEVIAAEEDAEAAAAAAALSETNASNASNVATAAANFKGYWTSLAGALNTPASVDHSGAIWALLNNLANVATSEPGVSADWVVVGGAFPTVRINTNTVAVPRRTYVIYGGCTLTAPAISGNGKQFGIEVLPGVTGAFFAPAGADKTRGVAGTLPINAPFKVILTDRGATDGWV